MFINKQLKNKNLKYPLSITKKFSTTCRLLMDNEESESESQSQKKDIEAFFNTMQNGTAEEKKKATSLDIYASQPETESDFHPLEPQTWSWRQVNRHFRDNNISREKQEDIFNDIEKHYIDASNRYNNGVDVNADEALKDSDGFVNHDPDSMQDIIEEKESTTRLLEDCLNELDVAKNNIMALDIDEDDNINQEISPSIASDKSENNSRQSPLDYVLDKQASEPLDIDDPDA